MMARASRRRGGLSWTTSTAQRLETAHALETTPIHSVGWKNPFCAWSARVSTKLPTNPPRARKTTQRAQSTVRESTIRSRRSKNPSPV